LSTTAQRGLIDASDLNKPIARLVWLQPMLELERAILDAVRRRHIDDKSQADALKGRRMRAQIPLYG
jgi:hypothetical protein